MRARNRIERTAAVVGCAALAAMGALVAFDAVDNGAKDFHSSGSMQTGVTTSPSIGVVDLATSVASPTEKAKAHWGQPLEP